MGLSLSIPTPLDYFESLVRSDTQLPLLEACISLGQDENPQLDVQQVLGEVDALLVRLQQRLPADAPAAYRLHMLNRYFFHELHFGGNVNDYYNPANSFLHEVVVHRRGIPVSLALLWLELAQGIGLPARGVGFPGHFMVKVNLPHAQVVIDPFNGQSLSREALLERLDHWRVSHGFPAAPERPLGHYLQTMPAREIIARMLRNLKEIYRTQCDWSRLVAVQNRLLILLPQAWSEYRDRGLAQAELGRYAPALEDLEIYLGRAEAGEDAGLIAERMSDLRRNLD
jgi:regulator of sirC expression with transglutaminase-like and TPR domain